MHFTPRTASILPLSTFQLHASAAPTAVDAPAAIIAKRGDILEDTPGDLAGDDLKAWNDCVAVTASENGFSCLQLGGKATKDGCLAAENTIQNPV
jgi:hypothetical protein